MTSGDGHSESLILNTDLSENRKCAWSLRPLTQGFGDECGSPLSHGEFKFVQVPPWTPSARQDSVRPSQPPRRRSVPSPSRVPMSPHLEGHRDEDYMYYSDKPRFLIDWSTYIRGPHGTCRIHLTAHTDLSDPSKLFSMLMT